MHILFVIGRVLLVLIFIISGTQKLLDFAGTAAMLDKMVIVPDALSGLTAQLQGMTGLTVAQLLAIVVGVVELVGGLLIAFNIGTRAAAIVLVFFTVLATLYAHDFWNMTGAARDANMVHVLKNLSMIGGLLIFVALGSRSPMQQEQV
jgi:putative oxidoreductase